MVKTFPCSCISRRSILYSIGAISQESLTQKYNNYLSCKQSNIELKSTELTKISEIHSIEIQLAKIDMEVKQELLFAFDAMMTKYNILINPIMAFGSGHHETTAMMTKWLLKEEIKDKDVLDMGCGTAILAIVAAKRGAQKDFVQ